MVKKAAIGLAVIALAVTAFFVFTGPDRHANPPGYNDHLPGNTSKAAANTATGTCKLISRDQIHSALGGSVGDPVADNLTPGVDSCSWPIKASTVGGDIRLIAYRPGAQPSASAKTASAPAGSTPVPKLGEQAYYLPAQQTLSYWRDGRGFGLQIVGGNATKPETLLAALDSLAEASK